MHSPWEFTGERVNRSSALGIFTVTGGYTHKVITSTPNSKVPIKLRQQQEEGELYIHFSNHSEAPPLDCE